MRYLFAAACALALAACIQETAQAPQEPPEAGGGPEATASAQAAGPAANDRTVDWEAARAARPADGGDAVLQVQSVDGSPPKPPEVPILLPSGVVLPQNARPPALVQTEDGYFATYQMAKYDAIVNGTKRAFVTGAAPASNDAQNMNFSVSDGAASLSFSRFGADYIIEFECRQTEGSESCITEQEAKAFADSLFVQQTQ